VPNINTRGLRLPRSGRLRLAPIRSRESIVLDQDISERMAESGREAVPFTPWPRFLESFDWRQGEHITLVGSWGSGKTTLARQLLPRRDYVVVLATKKTDPSLYEPLLNAGYVLRDTFDPDPGAEPRVIFRPKLSSPTAEGREEQREAFREALVSIFDTGGWCVYADEIRYLSDYLRLGTELETLWLQGRSLGISMVAGTQRPVSIPVLAFDANHLFFWRATDKRDIVTMSEFAGVNMTVAREVIPRLPKHEALYIGTRTDDMTRTKVTL
jgi:hypothetical protein